MNSLMVICDYTTDVQGATQAIGRKDGTLLASPAACAWRVSKKEDESHDLGRFLREHVSIAFDYSYPYPLSVSRVGCTFVR